MRQGIQRMPNDKNENTDNGKNEATDEEGNLTPKEGDDETFGREYVESLRKESSGYRSRAKEAEDELEEFRKSQMSEQEKAIDDARKEGAEQAADHYKPLLAQERVKAQASGEFTDPDDAIRYLDLDKIDLDDDYAIGEALTELLKDKPYLAAKGRTQGSIDQGPRGKPVEAKTGSDWVRQIAKG